MLRSAAGALALLLVLAAPAGAQLAKVETERIRIVYVAPTETYLVPHAARTLLNADAFLRELFDYKPTERVNALLVDFQDTATLARPVPRNSIRVQIAPLSFAFETITANERMNTIEPRTRARGVDGSGHVRDLMFGRSSVARSCPLRSSLKPSCISI